MTNTNNKIIPVIKYNNIIYNNAVVPIWDIVSNKQLNINYQLYKEALNNYIKDNYNLEYDEFIKTHTIIQNQNFDFNKSSFVIIKPNDSKKFFKVDLKKYWPNYQYINKGNKIVIINSDNKIVNDEIINIDYVRNEATLYNRASNIKYNIKLKNIDNTLALSNYLSTKDHFTNLIKK